MIGGWFGLVADAVRDGRVELVCSEAMLRELEVVMARPRIARCIRPEVAEQALGLYAHAVLHVDPGAPPNVCRDQSDDFLLALAVISRADVLVTRDADLLVLGRHGETAIVYPARFLQLIAPPGGGA